MNFQPPDPPEYGHCLNCKTSIHQDEVRGDRCIECETEAMTNKPTIARLQKLIDKMAADSRAALEMAKAVYGADAQLFCDTDCLVVMDGDEDEGVIARTAHVRLHAKGLFQVGGGAF